MIVATHDVAWTMGLLDLFQTRQRLRGGPVPRTEPGGIAVPLSGAGHPSVDPGIGASTVDELIASESEFLQRFKYCYGCDAETFERDIVAPMYDQGYSALIEDLFQRGMLDDTMVTCLAEFGRTPKINPAGGRDHWPNCWTVNFAGGGVKGGEVIGKSDDIGGYPTERPVAPKEIVATIYQAMGIDLTTELPGPQSRPYPVVDFGTQAIKELFA